MPGNLSNDEDSCNVPYFPYIRHLEQHGCVFDREGSRHTIYHNPQNKRSVAIPRHREIKDTTARTICEQISIPRPE